LQLVALSLQLTDQSMCRYYRSRLHMLTCCFF